MFLGMAFFKMGILTGEASVKTYLLLSVVGLTLGLTMSDFFLQPWIDSGFNRFVYTKNNGFQYHQIYRVFRSLGIFGLIMLLYKSGWFKWLFALMRPVGQMAFTNYLMQSILVAYSSMELAWACMENCNDMKYIMWLLRYGPSQIIWCHIWLRYFRLVRWSGHGGASPTGKNNLL